MCAGGHWNCPPSECWPSTCCFRTITSSRQTVTCQELRCKLQLPNSLWQKGRVGQPSRKWRTQRLGNIKWRVSVVSYEVVHALNQRAGDWESPSNTRTWWTKDTTGKKFHHLGISARGLAMTCRLRSKQKNRYLDSAALVRPHIRNCWFDGRAHLCAAEHLRGVGAAKQ